MKSLKLGDRSGVCFSQKALQFFDITFEYRRSIFRAEMKGGRPVTNINITTHAANKSAAGRLTFRF